MCNTGQTLDTVLENKEYILLGEETTFWSNVLITLSALRLTVLISSCKPMLWP